MPRPADPHARDALITAARAEFVRRGIKGARIEDITAACDLSKGAFYLHFESKEALFREVVGAFMTEIQRLAEARLECIEGVFRDLASPGEEDAAQLARGVERIYELEVEGDVQLLGHLWSHRDVLDVLISGSQGTEFEGLFWQMVEAEVQRVAHNMDRLQRAGVCRTDVQPHVFGSLAVGTYVLLAKQLARAEAKPDLAQWARSIHLLLREGNRPPGMPDATAVPPSAALSAARGAPAPSRPGKASPRGSARRAPTRSNPRRRP
jgi:AcrR family transcriptional regulator